MDIDDEGRPVKAAKAGSGDAEEERLFGDENQLTEEEIQLAAEEPSWKDKQKKGQKKDLKKVCFVFAGIHSSYLFLVFSGLSVLFLSCLSSCLSCQAQS